MGYEVGKNRLECVGDVEEAADLMAYYCDQIEQHNGFVEKMGTLGPGEDNVSVLRPYGVWAVISPFNFPLALAAGPAGGALAAGNTVVFKPASDTPLLGAKLTEMVVEAGPAAGRVQLRHRPGLDRRAGAHRQRRHRRHRLHRLEGSRAEADARQRGAPGAAAADYRDGRKESRHHHEQRRSRQGDRRRHALGVRRAGAEMLGVLARLHPERRARQVRAAAGRENQAHQDRQSARARRVDGTGHQRGRGQDVSLRDRAREEGWRKDSCRRKADNRAAVRSRLLRRADDHRRASGRAIRCFPKSCSCRSRSSPT